MRKFSPNDQIDVNNMTREELLYYNKRSQNNLIRRERNLRERMERDPGVLSPFGLRELEGGQIDHHGNVKEGIPSVSKNDGINTLRSKARRMEHLNRLETTTVKGAKAVQERQTRLSLGLPQTGRLSKEDRKTFNEGMDYNRDNPDSLATFWDAFEFYKRESQARMVDSDRLLNEFRPMFYQAREDGYKTMETLAALVQDYADEAYIQGQRDYYEAVELEEGSNWI